jgi:hydrogenase expression/formation protein HypE
VKNKGPVRMEHGSGGALSRELVEELIYPRLRTEAFPELSDASSIEPGSELMITTDGYVVDPPFFPGCDIGRLAVFGTCNDLAVSGAQAVALALGIIVEEGYLLESLGRVIDSVADAAKSVHVAVVTGDTKVVPSGKGGGVFLTTTGIGRRIFPHPLTPRRIGPGDRILVSGPIGAHGLSILAAREGLPVGSGLKSDAAPLLPLCRELFCLGAELKFLRDATRGGVAAVLNEMAQNAQWGILADETAFPIEPDVRAAAEILGLSPLEIANEGVMVAAVSEPAAEKALALLRSHELGRRASVVGIVTRERPAAIMLSTRIGGRRILDFPRGLLLPRIC